ncbi:hypothetical protein Tco_0625051 [Tanacetum coccineum]|uniref:Uncharacterized protein n=1 Tax=Tanacetum coccineum TaxID=301880 RepID=A0ABQ4WFU4_9ASTR
MTWFEQLETHLHDLYLLNSPYAVDAFKPAFRSFFGEEHQTFKLKMFHNLDQVRYRPWKEKKLHGVNAKNCLQALRHRSRNSCSKGVSDIQIKSVKQMDDSLIVSKGQFDRAWKHMHLANQRLKTQMQRQRGKVDMCEDVDAGLLSQKVVGTRPRQAGYK